MKKTNILIAMAAVAFIAGCKPEVYTGPLDSPEGNWDGIRSEYLFDGETVADIDTSCVIGAISFYGNGQCCIEDIKGAFPYSYDPQSRVLQIDSSIYSVKTLTGREMVIEFLETIFPDNETTEEETANSEDTDVTDSKPDKNGVILPVDYMGQTIYSDEHGYYYDINSATRVYCEFYGKKDSEGILQIDFWYDTHIDHFIPLIVEVKK